ncbi:hypothetical protein V0M98_32980 (plasmid) [Pseudomonas silesiensis]|uniref:hypothetical protein n=1 Tax=Pseudomonas silesiensis TaxID=1853130 RepID=UPI0030CF7AE3
MGMYDEVNFKCRMPDGYEGGQFQTKDLFCRLDSYVINPAGRLIREKSWDENDRPLGDMDYSDALTLCAFDSDTRTAHFYDLQFVDGTLIEILCSNTAGWQAFYPAPETLQPVED